MIGLTIMPLSDRLTRSTSDACSSSDRFLWMMPMPPCCAIAMASRDSVTVSIAALSSGTLTRMLRVTHEVTSTSLGRTGRVPRHQQHVVEGQRGREADRDLIGVQNVGRVSIGSSKTKGDSRLSLSRIAWLPVLTAPFDCPGASRAMALLVLLAAAARARDRCGRPSARRASPA